MVAHDNSSAGVPPQDRVVVAGGAYLLRLLIPFHRVAQPFIGVVARPRPSLLQPGLGLPLADNAGVIGALIFVLNARQQLFGLSGADGVALGESVGDRQ